MFNFYDLNGLPVIKCVIDSPSTSPRQCRAEFGDVTFREYQGLNGQVLEVHVDLPEPSASRQGPAMESAVGASSRHRESALVAIARWSQERMDPA